MKTMADGDAPVNQPMTLDEARSVPWLRNNPQSLGELLDRGYLNQGRLEWAAEKAYDARLRRAAQVLLHELKASQPDSAVTGQPAATTSRAVAEPVRIPVTLETAEKTLWPFAPYKGQWMGRLVEAQKLSLKDLVYAIENAWDDRVRQAAMSYAVLKLNQVVQEPRPPAGALHIISEGRSYSHRRELLFTELQGFLMGSVLVSAVWLLWESLSKLPSARWETVGTLISSPIGIVILITALVAGIGVIWLAYFLLDTTDKRISREIRSHQRGQEGEERVVEILRQNLDGQWYLFRNTELPGRGGDLDVVLVGPPGIWVLEVKMFTGSYRNSSDTWVVRAGGRWRKSPSNPSQQARRNASRLASFLQANGIKLWVNPVVVWANPEAKLVVESPATAVWQLDRLPEELGNAWHRPGLSDADITRIEVKLRGLCRSPAAS
jgi:hypothetical protein